MPYMGETPQRKLPSSISAYHMPSLMVVVALVVVTALYWMPAEAQTLSDDATLSALSVSPRDIIGFDADRTSYEVGVDPTVTTATVSATASHARASVTFHPADADDFTPGHSVALSAGRNLVTVTVTAEDGTTMEDYTVSVNRGVTDAKGWQAGADLDGMIAAGNNFPLGIWSDRTTMWVADSFDDMLYAYRLSDGTRDAGRRQGHHAGARQRLCEVYLVERHDHVGEQLDGSQCLRLPAVQRGAGRGQGHHAESPRP